MTSWCLWCLHGNLQLPTVWDNLAENLTGVVRAPDLFSVPAITATGFYSWARAFNAQVRSQSQATNFLLGYSLGGRLALHALATEPDLWAGAIVIAAHPGLQSTGERVQRRARDRIWARRFAREPLELVFSDWDSQAIFQQIPCPLPRSLAALSRARARAGFERFSLGLQTDLRPILQQLGRPPILYIAGKQDAKYLQLGRNLTAICPAMTLAVVPGAAHRVPWEQPTSFMESVRAFLAA